MIDEIPREDETAESGASEESTENSPAREGIEEPVESSITPAPEVSDDVDETSTEGSEEPAGEDDSDGRSSKDESARREFISQVLAGTIGAVVGLVPVLSGLVFFLDPLIRGDGAGDGQQDGGGGGGGRDAEGYIKLPVTRSLLPADGTPQQVTVEDDLVDAWNKFPKVPIGSVWLRRTGSGEVIAFSTICPHLGCAVEFRGAKRDFYCPCHLSAFKLDGSKNNPIPPRDMDTLAVKPDTGEEIWVQYKSFRGGISEKVET